MTEKEYVEGQTGVIICATKNCLRPANWKSIAEGNILGNNAPLRCNVCCNAIGDAIDLFIEHFDFKRKPLPDPNKNIWGTAKPLINANEYCVECEHVVGGHFDACPTRRTRVIES